MQVANHNRARVLFSKAAALSNSKKLAAYTALSIRLTTTRLSSFAFVLPFCACVVPYSFPQACIPNLMSCLLGLKPAFQAHSGIEEGKYQMIPARPDVVSVFASKPSLCCCGRRNARNVAQKKRYRLNGMSDEKRERIFVFNTT